MRKINTRDFSIATRTTSRDINRRIALNVIPRAPTDFSCGPCSSHEDDARRRERAGAGIDSLRV